MKKFAAVVAVAALLAFAAPVFAATNPFMDVPMNHWAYDAIGQLAAHGVLSGYPDGLYRGKQPTTRYEMASALARALALVDMTKASKQDVEMLKKLVVEFKDELEALGVKVDALDKRVKVLEDRLGGWKLSGQLRLDIENRDNDDPNADSSVKLARARLVMERWFGEDESMYFQARIEGKGATASNPDRLRFERFFVEMPFYWDSKLTVGRFAWDMEEDYYMGGTTTLPATGGFHALDSYLTDRRVDGLGWTKEFGMGSFRMYVSHVDPLYTLTGPSGLDLDGQPGNESLPLNAWELMMMAKLQFTEQFGFDFGGQFFLGDGSEWKNFGSTAGLSAKSLWTLFAGLRFNFNENIALKGIYYHQNANADVWDGAKWVDADLDNTKAWKLIVDVKQEALKFTSLWLEYGQMDAGFVVPAGLTAGAVFAAANLGDMVMPDDLTYWRVAAGQEWNEKWATHLFYYHYDFDTISDLVEWGLGVRYTYNSNVKFGLNYVKVDWDNDAMNDDHVLKFRTEVTF